MSDTSREGHGAKVEHGSRSGRFRADPLFVLRFWYDCYRDVETVFVDAGDDHLTGRSASDVWMGSFGTLFHYSIWGSKGGNPRDRDHQGMDRSLRMSFAGALFGQ